VSDAWQAVEALDEQQLDCTFKGVPLGETVTLSELGNRGWNVAGGDLALPVTTLRDSALSHNIEVMAAYARRHGVLLAPHGKTSMCPQLFRRQLDAGAWAITAGTPSQVAIMRRFGIPRILMANQLVEAQALRWVAEELRDDAFDFLCLVDSPRTVALMDDALDGHGSGRRLDVLVEVGVHGGRTGARSRDDAVATAKAIVGSRNLQLAGVEAYEGLAARGRSDAELEAVDALLDQVRSLVVDLWDRGWFAGRTPVVTAGGSIYFDRVVERLGDWSVTGVPAHVVLRSGCYVSHDAGRYHRLSPLGGAREQSDDLALRDALDAWAVVLSRPEPTLVVLGAGKRDVPYDVDLPVPQDLYPRSGSVVPLQDRASVTGLMDQHAFMRVDAELTIEPGDIVSLGLSHPCGAFEKSPLMPLVADDGTVVGGVLTFF
jgi:D-serine dehydratase